MIPARILGRDARTGKLYQAMRGEKQAGRWRWLEVTHEGDEPVTDGDIVFTFKGGIDKFPLSPPQHTQADVTG